MRVVSSFVLPLPGGASTTQLPSAVNASHCRGLAFSSDTESERTLTAPPGAAAPTRCRRARSA